jgi:membrane fusion protein (multidrug efflux system)
MITKKTYIYLLLISTLLISESFGNEGIPIFTKPSADVTLSFVQAGRIAKINFREGDLVKVGDVLVQQDDSVERVRLEQLEAESKDQTQILASEAKLALSKVDLKKREENPKATTILELEYARLNVKIAELNLRLAIFQNEQAQRTYKEAKLQIERMSLKSPIDGKIEGIKGIEAIETGESVNALEDVIRVVRIDPLWIDVPVPLNQTANLRNGHKALIEFPDPDKMSVEGTIVHIAAVANAGSGTLTVRVQVPNKTNRPAGEEVKITFPNSNQ